MTLAWTSDGHLDIESPLMVVAFEGWNDAADVASGALEHLELEWESTEIAVLAGDEYFDYGQQRPQVRHRGGVSRELVWPRVSVTAFRPEGFAHDVVAVRGPEPTLRWQAFTSEFVELVDVLEVTQVVLLGAFLADVPHTRDIRLTGTAYSEGRLAQMGIPASDYEGPTGIPGVLQHALTEAGIPTISVWAAVPHYVAAPPNPKATAAVLGWVRERLGIPVSTEALAAQASEWQARIDQAATEDDDLADYVRDLEQQYDAAGEPDGDDPEADRARHTDAGRMRLVDGEAIAAEFERFLRGEDGGTAGA